MRPVTLVRQCMVVIHLLQHAVERSDNGIQQQLFISRIIICHAKAAAFATLKSLCIAI